MRQPSGNCCARKTSGAGPQPAAFARTKGRIPEKDWPYAKRILAGLLRDPVAAYKVGTVHARHLIATREMQQALANTPHVFDPGRHADTVNLARLLQKEGSHSDADRLKMDARELMVRIQDEAQAAEMSEGTYIQNVTAGRPYIPGDFVGWYRRGWLL